MALSLWPGAEIDGIGRLRLAGAYWRRKRLESRLLASEVALALRGQARPGGERMSTAAAAEMWFQ